MHFMKSVALTLLLSATMLGPAKAVDRGAVEGQFRGWIETVLWPEAKAGGVSRTVFERSMRGVKLDWSLSELVPPGETPPKAVPQTQAEFSSPAPYFAEKRMAALALKGRMLAETHTRTLRRIEKAYGVPGSILLAIWGRETGYGAAKLPKPALDVLATKAFMSTRKELFHRELIAALHIIESGDADPKSLRGSSAGALGQPQFMPTSFLKHAVDFDGDGHRNIWTSVPDSLASMAKFLVAEGWQAGRPWGFEVRIPGEVTCAQEGPDLAKPVGEWASLGIGRISGKAFPASETGKPGMMLVPAGRHGPAFIVGPNFYVIKEYNNSDLYALFIGNLADRIAYGSGNFTAPFGDVGGMLRSDVKAIQDALVAQGYDVGKADGLAGYKTRRSIGAWQAKNGMAPTCYPEPALKRAIR
jgi:lytic murein transglycosylase